MAFLRGTEEYYQKFIELQEKLRQSEEDRLKLEIKFNEMVQVTREEEQAYYRKLRSQYKHFLEEDRRRQERNERIIRLLERIESRAAMLAAKTERFELLRKQYYAYLKRIFENMKQQNVSDTAETPHVPKMPTIVEQRPNLHEHPAIRKVLFDDEKPSYKVDIVKDYLNSLSKPTSREDVLKATRSSSRIPSATTDFSDTNGSSLSYCDLEFPQYAFNSSNIADEIVSSLCSRPQLTNSRADFKKSKDHFNEDQRFCDTKLSGKYHTNGTGEVKFLDRSKMDFDNQRRPQNYDVLDNYDKKYELKNLQYKPNEDTKKQENSLRRNVTFNDNKSDSKLYDDRLPVGGALNTHVANKNVRAIADDLEQTPQKKENTINTNQPPKLNLASEQTGSFGDVLEKIKDDALKYPYIDENDCKIATPRKLKNIHDETYRELNDNEPVHIQKHANVETKIVRTLSPVLNEEKKQTKHDVKYEENLDEAGSINQNNEHLQQFDDNQYEEPDFSEQDVYENYQPVRRDREEEIMHHLDDQLKYNEQHKTQYDQNGQVAEYDNNETANHEEMHCNFEQEQNKSQVILPEQTVKIAQDEQANQYDPNDQQNDGRNQPIQYNEPNQKDDQDHHIQYNEKERLQYDEQEQPPQHDESEVKYGELLDRQSKPIQYDANGKPMLYDEHGEPIHFGENSQRVQSDEHNQVIQYDERGQPIQIESHNYEEESKHIDEDKSMQYIKSEDQVQYEYHPSIQEVQYDENGQPVPQIQYDEDGQPVQPMRYEDNVQSVQPVQYDQNRQPAGLLQGEDYDKPVEPQQYGENGQAVQPVQYDEYRQSARPVQYDDYGQPVQPEEYDENGQAVQSLQYDENGEPIQPAQYDENGQPVQYDVNGLPIQYDENGQLVQPIQYDENGQPIPYYPQYDDNGQPIQQYYENNEQIQQYDENGQPIHQYDENGQPIQHYDGSGQPFPQYDETQQPVLEYDENGQPIYQYDPNSQYYQDGQQYEQQYDENSQPIQLEEQVQQQQASNANNQDDLATMQNVSENVSETTIEKPADVKQNEPEKQLNVMDMLDTDTESTKQETKVSNDSDFDFSNN